MTKYNVGDVLEITEDFGLEGAVFSKGEEYSVIEIDGSVYHLESDNHYFIITISLADGHPCFRKVVEFKAGVKVRLLETAHGSPGYSCDTPEKVKERLADAGLDYQTVFEVDQKVDSDGDVHVFHEESYVGMHLLPKFLVPAEEVSEMMKPAVQEETAKVVSVDKPVDASLTLSFTREQLLEAAKFLGKVEETENLMALALRLS